MFAKINHLAIASDQYALNGKFYEALFGFRTSSKPRPARAVVVGDGYAGLNIIPRRDGRPSGLDHFGIEVEDLDEARDRIHKFDPEIQILKRPPVRPFAAYSAYDPGGNIFDLSQRRIGFQEDIYADYEADKEWQQDRTFSHFAIRTRQAELCAQFYADVFELQLQNKTADDENFYLSDGRMTLMIIPWNFADYADMDPARTGPDHIGIKVESIEAVKRDMDDLIGQNPHLKPRPLGHGLEGEARLNLFKKCPLGQFQLTDIEGVYIDLVES